MAEPIIEVRDLCFAYPGERPALDRISFQMTKGETVGLVGPNGAGKTTFFLSLTGVLTPKSGSILRSPRKQ